MLYNKFCQSYNNYKSYIKISHIYKIQNIFVINNVGNIVATGDEGKLTIYQGEKNNYELAIEKGINVILPIKMNHEYNLVYNVKDKQTKKQLIKPQKFRAAENKNPGDTSIVLFVI